MLWKHKEGEQKLPPPRQIPQLVREHLVSQKKMDPDLPQALKAVVRKSPQGENRFDVRVFDPAQEQVKKITVRDYTSLNEHPTLILYEGWFDEKSKQVELEEKTKISYDVPLLSKAEIKQRIEALSKPGTTVFFYQARGPALGGPLGRGAAIIELNPNYEAGKKQKKYIISTADVDGMEPMGKGQKLWDSDKPEDIAKWVAEAHHKRMY